MKEGAAVCDLARNNFRWEKTARLVKQFFHFPYCMVLLFKRKKNVAAKEKELILREQKNVKLQEEINVTPSRPQQEISSKLAKVKQAQDPDFKNQIKVYRAMSASKRALLLDQMTDENIPVFLG